MLVRFTKALTSFGTISKLLSEGFILLLEQSDRKFIWLNCKCPILFKKLLLLPSMLEGSHCLTDMPSSINEYSVKTLGVPESNLKFFTQFPHPILYDFISWICSRSPCQLVHEIAKSNKYSVHNAPLLQWPSY